MFESLKQWLHDRFHTEDLFENKERFVQVAFASLLYHVIQADGVETEKETHKFNEILQQEFDLSDLEVEELYQNVSQLESDLTTDLNIIRGYIKDDRRIHMSLMNKLNQLINVDGAEDAELEVFDEAMRVMFPELHHDDDEDEDEDE